MERTLKREIRLNEDEISEAVRYWLTNKYDIQIGENNWIEFEQSPYSCAIHSQDEAIIELTQEKNDHE